ncbi:MAG: DUF4405 domain-containing protein, partial [Desulfurococcaceae archaeon]
MSISLKVKACYVNFILLLATGVVTGISGFVLWLILPRGQVRGRTSAGSIFLGLSRGVWEDIHIVAGLLFLMLIVIHLILNWAWIKSVTKCLI